MKKILVLFLALSIVGGATFAQNATVGTELKFDPLNCDNQDVVVYFRPFFNFGATDIGPGIDVFAEVGVNFSFADNMGTALDFEIDIAYNLPVTPEGTLTFGLNFSHSYGNGNGDWDDWDWDFDDFSAFAPAFDDLGLGDMFGGHRLAARVVYTHDLGGMSFFGGLELGFEFLTYDNLGDDIDMEISAGMTMGMDPGVLGFNVGLEMVLQEGGESPGDTVQWLSLLPNFTFAALPLYVELEVRIPLMSDGMDDVGISLIPEVRYGITDTLEAWLNMPMRHVTGNPDLLLGLGLGIQFSF